MARRGLHGQLNMFDFFNSLDDSSIGEVEMVSLVPEYDEPEEVPEVEEVAKVDEIPQIDEIPQTDEISLAEEVIETTTEAVENVDTEKVAMSRQYEKDGTHIEIAYINYNKVRIIKGTEPAIIKEFASSKEAVDYYVEKMQEYEADE